MTQPFASNGHVAVTIAGPAMTMLLITSSGGGVGVGVGVAAGVGVGVGVGVAAVVVAVAPESMIVAARTFTVTPPIPAVTTPRSLPPPSCVKLRINRK